MSDQFLGEIRIVPFNFAPSGWALCNGQILPISQNTALFSLLGTYYGGNGTTNFALPNLQGATPLQVGQGPGLSLYDQGQSGGTSAVTLLSSEMPSHTHAAQGVSASGQTSPAGHTWGVTRGGLLYAPAADSQMALTALPTAGSSQAHNNLPPYLVLNFIIALTGIFPPRP